jgi:signal transduction histidine kinase
MPDLDDRMQRKWGIARKGLILISVPLAFELIFLFIIGFVLTQVQIQLDNASRSRQIVACANDIGRMLLQVSAVAGARRVISNPALAEQYEHLKDEIFGGYSFLESMVEQQHKPDDLKQLLQSHEVLTKTFHELDEFEAQSRPGSLSAILNTPRAKKISTETDAIGRAMLVLVNSEEQEAIKGIKVRKELMLRVQLLLASGFLINALITVWLASYFWRGVASRLNCVMDNSARLASRTPLRTPLTGSDEIAQLDQVFHGAVSELRELERVKLALTAAITKRIESPLQEVSDITHAFLSEEFGALDEKTRTRLRSTATSSERLMRLLNDLRGPSSGRDSTGFELKFRNADLVSIVQTAFSTVEQLAASSAVKLVAEVDPSLKIHGDRDRLIQVVVNLLSNAIKFSPADSCVTVSARQEDDTLILKVTDQGPGIAKEFQDKIFGLYEQAHARDAAEKGGSGLGLVICRNIVRRHGGTISLQSEPGEGTTFIVCLPNEQAPCALAKDG